MTAELRRVGNRVWVVDLACGIEEAWNDDQVGAIIRADDHNESHHAAILDRDDLHIGSVSHGEDLQQLTAV